MRFCNKCGAVIIGIQCNNCFGMQNNSLRLRPLNRDIFVSPNNVDLNLINSNRIERGLDKSALVREGDLSRKLSENRANLIDRKLEILNVAEKLQKINSEDEKIFNNEIVNQDPILKRRLEWIKSIKTDVGLKGKEDYKSKKLEIDIKADNDKILEEKKHNI